MAVLGRLALLLVVLAIGGCHSGPEQWGPFRGQVVDAETGRPIAGVHVMVTWERANPNPVHWTQGFYDAQESVTDAQGRFEIPRAVRAFTLLVTNPTFAVFAPAYVAAAEEVTPTDGRLFVDSTVLRMRLLRSPEERCQYLPPGPGVDASAKAPRFADALRRYREALNCRWPEGRPA